VTRYLFAIAVKKCTNDFLKWPAGELLYKMKGALPTLGLAVDGANPSYFFSHTEATKEMKERKKTFTRVQFEVVEFVLMREVTD